MTTRENLPQTADILFISLEPWDEIWRRNQFVCAELARRHPNRTILFVTPPRDISNALRRMQWGRLKAAPTWSPEGLPNVVVSTPSKYVPNSLGVGRSLNSIGLRNHVLAEMRRLGLDRPILWINDHAAVSLVGTLDESAVIYDVTDDWISFDQSDALRERTRSQDARLCKRADAVTVCSQRLHEMKASLVPAGRLHLIPNGVDAAHYARVLDSDGPLPANAGAWPKPVFGYTGTIHPDRVDVALLESLGRNLKAGSIVLIGPNHLTAEQQQRLRATGRVKFVGPVPYRDIPDYMRGFDVCIVPHRMTAFTESLNPIKLWEYLAAGKPIVSTDVAGFRDFPQFVRLAREAEAFFAQMQASLSEDSAVTIGRRQLALMHGWTRRVDAIEAVTNAAAGDRHKRITSTAVRSVAP